MIAFIVRRVFWLVVTLFVIATCSFFLIRFTPGGPFDRERNLPPAIERNIRARYHLDEPLIKQYALYLGHLAHGDLGPSFKYVDRSVNEIIRDSFPVSLTLGAFALMIALLVGVPAGTVAAVWRNRWPDHLLMAMALAGIAMPSFVLAVLLLAVFCFGLHALPVAGWGTPAHMVLPGLTLAAPFAAYLARLMRGSMLETLNQDYMSTARAKGLSVPAAVFRHALKNAILPVVTFLGPATAGILTGSLVVERIFAVPGIGAHFVNSALNRDYTLALGTVLLYSVLLMVLNLAVDIAYAYVDPRVKLE